MAWVPLHEVSEFDFQPGGLTNGSAEYSDSTIVFSGVSNAFSAPYAYSLFSGGFGGFVPDALVRVRVVCTAAYGDYYPPPNTAYVSLTGSSQADRADVWTSDFHTFDVELQNTADNEGNVRLRLQWGAYSTGGIFYSADFVFSIYVWVDAPDPDPDPEPVGCFWTDLVNVTQECSAAPTPDPEVLGVVEFSNGQYHFLPVVTSWGDRPESLCSEDLAETLMTQPEVRLTGYTETDELDHHEICGRPIPAGGEWTEVSVELVWSHDVNFGYYYGPEMSVEEWFEPWQPYFVRISVGGETHYGYYVLVHT